MLVIIWCCRPSQYTLFNKQAHLTWRGPCSCLLAPSFNIHSVMWNNDGANTLVMCCRCWNIPNAVLWAKKPHALVAVTAEQPWSMPITTCHITTKWQFNRVTQPTYIHRAFTRLALKTDYRRWCKARGERSCVQKSYGEFTQDETLCAFKSSLKIISTQTRKIDLKDVSRGLKHNHSET